MSPIESTNDLRQRPIRDQLMVGFVFHLMGRKD